MVVSLIEFDILDPDYTTRLIFDFQQDDNNELKGLTDVPSGTLSNFGYDTMNPILNMGGVFIFFTLYFLHIAILVCISLAAIFVKKSLTKSKDIKYEVGISEIKLSCPRRCSNYLSKK